MAGSRRAHAWPQMGQVKQDDNHKAPLATEEAAGETWSGKVRGARPSFIVSRSSVAFAWRP